jgi:hypothetical protein
VTFPYRLIFATTAAISSILLAGSFMVSGQTPPSAGSDGWVPLLNGKNFDGWYTFLPSTGKNNCEDGPLMLQDHYRPDVKETFMQFRNIWIRPLS